MPPTSTSDPLLSLPSAKQLEAGDFDVYKLTMRLAEALVDEIQRNEILQLKGDSAALVIECLDKVALSGTVGGDSNVQTLSREFFMISKLSRRCQHLPHSYWIDPWTITIPKEPHTSGTRAQVYRAARNGQDVAVKVLRTSKKEDLVELKKRFCSEATMWGYALCPHISKFYGVFYYNGVPAIVTPWMRRGNITEYLEKHPEVDRLQLLSGALRGIEYLHKRDIAHGDVKATSILISDSTPPRSMLTDFGSAYITTAPMEMQIEEQGISYFMAPELLLPTKYGLEKRVPSREADIYALGMTIYQILTSKQPFLQKRKARVMYAVILGERPVKPENAKEIGMTDAMWDLLKECWMEDRVARPDITEVLKKFRGITASSGQDSPSQHRFPSGQDSPSPYRFPNRLGLGSAYKLPIAGRSEAPFFGRKPDEGWIKVDRDIMISWR